MKYLTLILILLLQGCVNISYSDGEETLRVSTFFKSLDGFDAEREGFKLKFDKSHTVNPIEAANDVLDLAGRIALTANPEPTK